MEPGGLGILGEQVAILNLNEYISSSLRGGIEILRLEGTISVLDGLCQHNQERHRINQGMPLYTLPASVLWCDSNHVISGSYHMQ